MNKWEVLVYHKGKRIVKSVPDAKAGLALVEQLKVKEVTAHLVSRLKAFPPKGVPNDGELWCPYCRRWREFRVPQGDEDAPIGSYSWQNAVLSRLEIPICPWCGITTQEFHVKTFNNLWLQDGRRRRAKKAGRRHRTRRVTGR